jgi:hypothetical protein
MTGIDDGISPLKILVSVLIRLWIFALVGDVLALLVGGPEWPVVAFYAIGGCVGARSTIPARCCSRPWASS